MSMRSLNQSVNILIVVVNMYITFFLANIFLIFLGTGNILSCLPFESFLNKVLNIDF